MRNLWELTLKMFFNSPEMNRSRHLFVVLLRMSKKMDYFLSETSYAERERVIPWFNMSPIPFIHRNDAWWIISKFSSLRFCFCLWSACKNPSPSVVTLVFQADLQELLCRCCSNPSQIYLMHEKFITQDWVLSSLRDQILISTPCLPYRQLVVTSSTGLFFVFPWIHPFGCDDPSFLGKVYSRQATA